MKKKVSRISIILLVFALVFSTATCFSGWGLFESSAGNRGKCNPHIHRPQMVKIPLLKKGCQIVERCDLANPKDVAFAIIIFENAWRQTFGKSKPLLKSLNNIMIEWSTDYKTLTGYNVDGIKHVNSKVIGLARSPTWIWAKIKPGQKLCETALVHELVHIAIWAEKSTDADPDHEGSKWSGWTPEHTKFINRVNRTLCATDI